MERRLLLFNLFIFITWSLFAQTSPNQCGGGSGDGGFGNPDNLGTGYEPDIKIPIIISLLLSLDPNEIIGPPGYDTTAKWVSSKAELPYKILFENDPEFATGPARKVMVYMPLHPNLNPNTLRLSDFGFGSYIFSVPPNTTAYTQRLDVRDSLGVFVDVTAGLDITNRRAFWIFESVDPATGLAATLAADTGFLPVNDKAKHNGEGFVSLTIQAAPEVHTRDSVTAEGTIVFDINEPIPTNIEYNIIDAVAPTSKVKPLPASSKATTITINWSGKDDANGSGVRDYALYVSENGAPFTPVQTGIKDTFTTFTGYYNNTYSFFTLATDNTGNQEVLKEGPEAVISITEFGLPVTWLYFTGQQNGKDVQLNWATVNENNSKEFVVERSLNGSQFAAIGTVTAIGNSTQTTNYQYVDKDATNLNSKTLYYRLQQVDKDGRVTYSKVVSIPIRQTNAEITIRAYPNPFVYNITLQIITVRPTDETNKVELYSVDGKLMYQRKLSHRGSTSILLDNLPALTPGVYILRTVVDKKVYTIKMIRQ